MTATLRRQGFLDGIRKVGTIIQNEGTEDERAAWENISSIEFSPTKENDFGLEFDAQNINGEIMFTEGAFTNPEGGSYSSYDYEQGRIGLAAHEIFHSKPTNISWAKDNPPPSGEKCNWFLEYMIDRQKKRIFGASLRMV